MFYERNIGILGGWVQKGANWKALLKPNAKDDPKTTNFLHTDETTTSKQENTLQITYCTNLCIFISLRTKINYSKSIKIKYIHS
jgi:hypothetical protein